MIEQALKKIVDKNDLSGCEMEGAIEEIMRGDASPVKISAFLVGLRMKGETVVELTAGAKIMRRYAMQLELKNKDILDTCGTGGDNTHTFNISTISALVAAGAGVTVAKHGNRAVSSRCGSADLLKGLGVNIEADKSIIERCIKELGFGFLFAPLLHTAMKNVAPVRRELEMRTIFNILGPLTNPSGAAYQLLGVFDGALTQIMAEVLRNLGTKHALIVYGDDGLDEITTTAQTQVSELKNGAITTYKISPEDFGLKRAKSEDISGGDVTFNAKLARDILNCKPGPKTDIVLLNAGCAIYAANGAKDMQEGLQKARESLESRNALRILEKLIEYTNVAMSTK